jgi:hypothetical protein
MAIAARNQRGQAAVELVVAVPIVLIVVLAVAQLGIAGFALWTAGDAARTGARAELVGGEPEEAARSVLPGWLEQGAEVEVADGVSVSVRAPALLPGVPAIPIRAASVLDPLASDDG